MKLIAIDPGWGGAVAYYISRERKVGLTPCPGDAAGILDFLSSLQEIYGKKKWLAGLENNHASPVFGARGNFGLGLNVGSWETALLVHNIEIEYIAPKDWQALVSRERSSVKKGRKMWKEKSWRYARREFPSLRELLGSKPPSPRNKKQGYADALCILSYLKRKHLGSPGTPR